MRSLCNPLHGHFEIIRKLSRNSNVALGVPRDRLLAFEQCLRMQFKWFHDGHGRLQKFVVELLARESVLPCRNQLP